LKAEKEKKALEDEKRAEENRLKAEAERKALEDQKRAEQNRAREAESLRLEREAEELDRRAEAEFQAEEARKKAEADRLEAEAAELDRRAEEEFLAMQGGALGTFGGVRNSLNKDKMVPKKRHDLQQMLHAGVNDLIDGHVLFIYIYIYIYICSSCFFSSFVQIDPPFYSPRLL
jgi:hypothetical protein